MVDASGPNLTTNFAEVFLFTPRWEQRCPQTCLKVKGPSGQGNRILRRTADKCIEVDMMSPLFRALLEVEDIWLLIGFSGQSGNLANARLIDCTYLCRVFVSSARRYYPRLPGNHPDPHDTGTLSGP